jgi:hypothetical protein
LINIFYEFNDKKMIGLIVSFIQSLFVNETITNDDDERECIKDMRYRLHHELIQKKINKSILNGYVTRNMPEHEEDGHWATWLKGDEDRDSELQFQAENCLICGEYRFPYPIDNEKIYCRCGESIHDEIPAYYGVQ